MESKHDPTMNSGKQIYESILVKMRTGEVTMPGVQTRPKTVVKPKTKTSHSLKRCPAPRCPLRWLGCETGPIKDLRKHLLEEHNFQSRRHLPKRKRFCTSSLLQHEPKEQQSRQHLLLPGGRQLACVVGFHPDISRTHGLISIFAVERALTNAGHLAADTTQGRQAPGMSGAKFTWNTVPAANADLEPQCGLFPLRLFTPRLLEGKPHERLLEVTIKLEAQQVAAE
eukprot:g20675.t1